MGLPELFLPRWGAEFYPAQNSQDMEGERGRPGRSIRSVQLLGLTVPLSWNSNVAAERGLLLGGGGTLCDLCPFTPLF